MMNNDGMAARPDGLASTVPRDLTAGLVVFLVAMPLCLGVALASGAPPFSGLLAGIIGGIVVGLVSGSQTSVSGPAAGLTAIVAAQIVSLGSFQAFLLAVFLAGVIQLVMGIARAGFLSAFIPSGVIKGLLAAIGIILILKQIPHVLGRDLDPEGEMSFHQTDHENTFSELFQLFGNIHPGAALIGLGSVALLVLWDRWKPLKKSLIPAPLVVVMLGVVASLLLRKIGGQWVIERSHLVDVPVAENLSGFLGFLQWPDFSQWTNPAVYLAAGTIAAVASLETLLNLEAVDRIDPRQRVTPASRELLAQGFGNMVAGLVGGLPTTSVIVRSSVNLNAGARTKLSTIVHGMLLLASAALIPAWLNMIPVSCLAAILLVTGVKLTSPAIIRGMWNEGRYKFIPFAVTAIAIVLTDLLIGVLIGLAVSASFILWHNTRRPLRKIVEKHLSGEVVRIELASQVSFLGKAALVNALDEIPHGGRVLLDAHNCDYIDPDVLDLLRDFKEKTGPARGIEVSLVGFRKQYRLEDITQFVDYSTREIQNALSPQQVLRILKEGHDRFRSGKRLTRDLGRQVTATAKGQHPLAVVLSCIDSRTPAELVFDLGVGDIFSVRMAGNIATRKVLGSVEFATSIAGAKLVVVMGHTRCGAVSAAVNYLGSSDDLAEATGCRHLGPILHEIQRSVAPADAPRLTHATGLERESLIDEVARRNVARTVEQMIEDSPTIEQLASEGRIAVVGAMYNVATGDIEFLTDAANCPLDSVEAV